MPWIFARVAGSVLAAATVALAVAAPASGEAAKNPGVGASTTVACGTSYPAKVFGTFVNFPVTTVTLRSGPSNSCIQTGQGMPGQLAEYLCYAPGDGGTWTFLRNVSTGNEGWVRDDLLPADGSEAPCEPNPPPAAVNGGLRR